MSHEAWGRGPEMAELVTNYHAELRHKCPTGS